MLKKLLSLSLFVFIISGSFYGLPSIFSPNKAFADTKVLPVVELFTAEWCGPCVTANHNVDDLLNELGRESFTLFKHHSPGNGGMNNPYGSKRNQKFKIKGIPAVVINGVVSGYDVNQLAWNKDDLKRRILEKNSETTKSTLSIDGKISKNKVDGEVSYTGFPAGSNLHIVFCEQYFYFAGSNGERLHRMISRDGIITMAGSKGSKKYSFIIPSTMPPEMVRIAAFVELQNGEIVHSGDFNPSGIDVSKDGISTMPNELDMKSVTEGIEQILELNVSNFNTSTTTVEVKAKDDLLQIIQGSFSLSSVSPNNKVKVVFRTRSPLALGSYNTSVIVSSGAYRKEIPLKFDLVEGPLLQIADDLIDFGIVKRGEKSSKTFLIQNERKNGTLKGSISMDVPWLEISPREIKTDYELVTVSVLTGKLSYGDYQGKITVTTNVRKVDIPVSLSVSASLLQAESNAIDFGEISEENLSSANQTLTLSNKGSETASVNLDKVPEFISVSKRNYQLPAGEELSIQLAIVEDKIKINQINTGTLEISYTDGTLSIPISISVKEMPPMLQITSAQELGEELSFELKSGASTSFELQMENIGRGRLDGKISYKKKQAWISSSNNQFALLRGQKRTITFTLNSEELKAGTYQETVLIQSNGGSQEYLIALIVQKDPIIIELQIGSKNATISGKAVTVDPPPYIKSGTTLVPLRFISEAFGAEIEWLPKQGKGTIIIKLKEHLVQIEIGNTQAMVNGKAMTLIVAPEIVNGRTFVPLRFISEAFGAKVEWIAETQTIRMIYEG
jgi:thiol-disulfide isomerase/thioredoxin